MSFKHFNGQNAPQTQKKEPSIMKIGSVVNLISICYYSFLFFIENSNLPTSKSQLFSMLGVWGVVGILMVSINTTFFFKSQGRGAQWHASG